MLLKKLIAEKDKAVHRANVAVDYWADATHSKDDVETLQLIHHDAKKAVEEAYRLCLAVLKSQE